MSPRLRFALFLPLIAATLLILIVLLLTPGGRTPPSVQAQGNGPGPSSTAALSPYFPVVINEVMPLPVEGESAWVELFINTAATFLPFISNNELSASQATESGNGDDIASPANNLAGWQIGDGDGNFYTFPADLPGLPPQTYVLIHFDGKGEEANDYDASDGRIELHTPPTLVDIFDAVDQVALFSSSVQTTTTLADFVAYGDFPEARANLAVQAGEWPPDTFAAPTTQIPGGDVLIPGGSFGRYPIADTNGAEEWTIYKPGETTPGAANRAPAPYFRTP